MSGAFSFGLPATDLGGGLAGIGRLLAVSSEQERKRALSGQVGTALQGGDYTGAAKAAFDAGDTDTGLGLVKLGQALKQQQSTQAASDRFSQGVDLMYPSGGFGGGRKPSTLSDLDPSRGQGAADPSRAVPSFADASAPSGSYLANLTKRESNGNPNARNPNSTATGLGQFTEGTWRDLARRRPDLSLTPDGRTDPAQAMRATAAFTGENEQILTRAGLPVNDATRYAVHIFGQAGGPRFVAGAMQNPEAPAASFVKPDQVAANRQVFFNRDGSPKTARQVVGDFQRSFGGGRGGGGGAPAPAVAYADSEGQTQALEQRMGMMPTQTAEADMPVRGGQEAAFYIPGTDPAAASAPPARSPFGPDGSQGPAIEQSALSGNQAQRQGAAAPSLPVGGAPNRVMALPGAPVAPGGAPGGSGPVSVGGGTSAIGNVSADTIGQAPLGQRIPFLLKAAAMPNLPDGQRQLAQILLKEALDKSKVPDGQKDYLLARSQGYGGTYLDYQRELKRPGGPTKLSPGESVYDEGSNSIRITAPDRSRSNVSDDVEARRAAAADIGLVPGTREYQTYVLTGKTTKEDQPLPTASDRKAVQDADTAVLSAQNAIDALNQAKQLSPKAYEGIQAGNRGYVSSLFGSEAGAATSDLDNLVTTQALGQLKTIFGGNPTEGERAILLQIQGSTAQPDKVRQRIYERGIGLAKLRLQQNQEKADELRGGTYYKPGGGPSGPGAGPRPMPSRALPAPSPSNRPGAANAAGRFGELTGSGMSREQAYQQLQQEGY